MEYSVAQQTRAEQITTGVLPHLINGLTVIYGRALLARDRQPNPAVAQQLDHIVRQVERLTHLTRVLSTWTGYTIHRTEMLDLNALVQEVAPRLQERSQASASLELHLEDVGRVVGSRAELEAALGEIIMNALEAQPEARVCIRTRQVGDMIHIEVEDDGEGLNPEVEVLAYQPFYTTKTGHFGLGLNVAGEVVTRHRGDVRLERAADKGTKVTVALPAVVEPA